MKCIKFLRRLKRPVETAKEDIPPCVPAPKIRVSGALSIPLTPVSLNYPQQAFDAALFPVEENAVIAQLRHFARRAQTSMRHGAISLRLTAPVGFPPAATGGLSPRQCLHRLLAEQPQALDGGPGSVWLNELIWREFYRHLMTGIRHYANTSRLSAGQNASRGRRTRTIFRHGRKAKPVIPLSMRRCASLTRRAGCITVYA